MDAAVTDGAGKVGTRVSFPTGKQALWPAVPHRQGNTTKSQKMMGPHEHAWLEVRKMDARSTRHLRFAG